MVGFVVVVTFGAGGSGRVIVFEVVVGVIGRVGLFNRLIGLGAQPSANPLQLGVDQVADRVLAASAGTNRGQRSPAIHEGGSRLGKHASKKAVHGGGIQQGTGSTKAALIYQTALGPYQQHTLGFELTASCALRAEVLGETLYGDRSGFGAGQLAAGNELIDSATCDACELCCGF